MTGLNSFLLLVVLAAIVAPGSAIQQNKARGSAVEEKLKQSSNRRLANDGMSIAAADGYGGSSGSDPSQGEPRQDIPAVAPGTPAVPQPAITIPVNPAPVTQQPVSADPPEGWDLCLQGSFYHATATEDSKCFKADDCKISSECCIRNFCICATATNLQGECVPGNPMISSEQTTTTPPPDTSAPGTPAPITPMPATPAPGTPLPATPVPETPAPGTPLPATSVPATPAPGTPAPGTPAPGTLQPYVPPPVSPPPVTLPPTTPSPTSSPPTIIHQNVTYIPGQLTVMERDLILSEGLTSRIIALSGMPVLYDDGTTSADDFHVWPDGAACFPDTRPGNPGGWVYASNAEDSRGGVGAITFDSNGGVIDYRMILTGTKYNCNGGKTPWDTWISAEEDFDKREGRAWQVDPFGIRQPEPINMGLAGGSYEAFAFDVRSPIFPRFFLTEDNVFGALERFTPVRVNWTDPWNILNAPGVNEWLILEPDPNNSFMGTYRWTTNLEEARENAAEYYPESEGIDVAGATLVFVCKGIKQMFSLNLDGNTYRRMSTGEGLFEGEPDQVRSLLSDEPGGESMLYFTEDNGRRAGIHARKEDGELVTILEGFYSPETTGLAFSPNKMYLYVCFQEDGYCFAVWRKDGLSFKAKSLNVKAHPTELATSRANGRNSRD